MDVLTGALVLLVLAEAAVIVVLYRRTRQPTPRTRSDLDRYCEDRIAFELECLERRIGTIDQVRTGSRLKK